MSFRKGSASSRPDPAKPARARSAGSVFKQLGTKMGVLESNPSEGLGGVSPEEVNGVPSSLAGLSASPQEEYIEATAPTVNGVLGEQLSEELELLNRALAGESASQQPVGVLHSVLSEKRTAVIAFEGMEREALLGLLEFQRS